MNSFYLLSYNQVPIGIYNKLPYLFDYILELIRFPSTTLNIYKIEINIFEVNIGYPSATFIFKYNPTMSKIFLEETNGKRVEMSSNTFSKFKKIQNYFKTHLPVNNIIKPLLNKANTKITSSLTTTPTSALASSTPSTDTFKQPKEKKLKSKKEIYKLNRLKYKMNLLEKWKNKFNCDLKLYNEFKNKNENENKFVIPEMFLKVWNFFNEQENPDNSFTLYFNTFNENSKIELEEINKLLNSNEIESDSSDNESIKSVESDETDEYDESDNLGNNNTKF
ncbi:hypothetical protein crov278 [Cafeteria roenbergensis virus]|uniref:Uncharacterized protein n=1 Tax=Cafeteria roenbergensis virus (strain BV-PW1) TaxID=693272 RepID=E3T548_CROVB|nr:hypothetical protein crov278 [Cafeteria roenbergensis virus BV-PW1]ADO67311.1 hypothetical protein crov278 [Cafeteria roenbergensis virus BV-PW1]